MAYLLLIILASIATRGLFRHLIKQSKNSKGWMGRQMMRFWNSIYLPMVDWSIAPLMAKLQKEFLTQVWETENLHNIYTKLSHKAISMKQTFRRQLLPKHRNLTLPQSLFLSETLRKRASPRSNSTLFALIKRISFGRIPHRPFLNYTAYYKIVAHSSLLIKLQNPITTFPYGKIHKP